jgi:predicted RNA-binding protein YlxR (DUF448 family)
LRLETAERNERPDGPTADAVRRCAVTRAERPKDDLIRFVLGPDGTVVPDLKEKLPGRGVWLTADHNTVAEAVKRKVFSRALKAEVKVPESLADDVGKRLAEAAVAALSLANKAGQVVFGHAKVEEALGKSRILALVHASDAAEDGCRKLDAKARSARGGAEIPVVRAFSADELGLASGRTNVIHAALIQGGAAQKFLAAASRVESYRKGISAFADRYGLDTEQE